MEEGRIAPFSPTETSYAAMGRFGNVFLTSGDLDLRLEAGAGEVVRLWLTNTANTRVFNLAVTGARMKLVGGDSGRVEHEELVESVVLAPSERAVVDVLVERPGELHLEHQTPDRTYRLATVTVGEAVRAVGGAGVRGAAAGAGAGGRARQLDRWLAAAPDKVLALVAQMDDPAAMPAGAGPVTYACPMHPEVTSPEPGRCPKCGMKLLATQGPAATAYACPMHPEVVSEPGRCPKCGMKLLATAAPTSYVCPMHPEVTSDQPGQSPCGMKLLPAESVPKPTAPLPPRWTSTVGTLLVTTTAATTARGTAAPRGSSGKTTWSRSTASPPPPPCTGSSWTGPPAPTAPRSTGSSRWASGSSSGW